MKGRCYSFWIEHCTYYTLYMWFIGKMIFFLINWCSLSFKLSETWLWRKLEPKGPIHYILPIFIFSIVYNLSRFFEFKTQQRFYLRNVTSDNCNAYRLDIIYGNNDSFCILQENVTYFRLEHSDMRTDPRWVNFSYSLWCFALFSHYIAFSFWWVFL